MIFQGKFPKNFDFFQVILYKISIFHGKFQRNIDFSGKNWLFTAVSRQIILFLFKSHNFRIYFLYMIRYNNILRPVHDPTTPCSKSCGVATPQLPRIDAYASWNLDHFFLHSSWPLFVSYELRLTAVDNRSMLKMSLLEE